MEEHAIRLRDEAAAAREDGEYKVSEGRGVGGLWAARSCGI